MMNTEKQKKNDTGVTLTDNDIHTVVVNKNYRSNGFTLLFLDCYSTFYLEFT